MAAISSIQKLIKEFEDLKRQKKSLQSAARHANCIGKEFIKIGKFNEAVKYHEEEVQLSHRCNDVLGAGIAERCIVDAYIEMGFHDKAEKHCILYQKYVDDAKSVDELQRVFHTFGRLYLTMAEAQADDVNEKSKLLEKADSFFRNALRQCDLLDEHTADLSQRRANALSNLALVLRSQGLPLQAMEHIKKGIKEAKKMCDGRDKQGTLCYCYADASDILFYMNTTAKTDCPELLEEAVEYVKLAIPLAEQLKDFSRLLDFHNQMAEMFTVLLKFEEAMRHLKSAWKLCSKQKRYFVLAQKANLAQANNDADSPGDIAIAVKRYKKLRLFVQKSKDLRNVAYEETAAAAKRYEAMGDLSSDHKYFRLACRCYKLMAEIARQLNDSTSEAAAYVSLAGTSEDLELYDAAIYWYEKELCLHKESLLEEAKSYYNIAVCQKRLNRGSITVVESFKKAANLADNCGDEKLKINTYREWYEYLVQVNATDSIVFHEYPFLNDPAVQDADEDSRRSDNDRSSSVSSTMSSDSDSNGDEPMDVEEIPHNLSASRPIRQKRMKIKRNQKGESQLHLACIRGDIRIVNMLLSQGHDLTVRDNAGWTPLHEACNHGHIEVVRLLLSFNFVDINAKGMAELTPLHDALQAGSFDVAVELLKHPKIDVTRKTSEGLDALDFIDGWLESFAESIENDDENADRELLVRLRADISERMKQQNYRHVSNRALAAKSFSVEQQKRRAKRGGANDASAANDKEGNDASTDDGAEAYKRTIAGIGRSALSRSILKRSRRVADEPLSPFVHDEDLPASDKWLIDDSAPLSRDAVSVKAKSRQRKQPSVARKTARSTVSFDFEQPRRSHSPTAALSNDLFTSEAAASQRLRQDSGSRHHTNNPVPSISATDSDRVHRISADDIIDVVDDVAERSVHFVPCNSNIHKASRDLPRSHAQSPFSDRGNYQNVSSRRRVQNLDEDTSTTVASIIASKTTIFKYQYDGSSYMTSFVASEKIKDIEGKIIQRHELKVCDKAPVLKLFKDGAELDSEDFAESFIANGNELTAKIISSCVVSLSDLYKSNCAKENARVYANVVEALEFSRSFELSFEDFLLDSTSVKPALQALRSGSSIVVLNLSGNQLARCLTLLGEVCVHLASTLTQLNLSQSLLAASDLNDLVVALQNKGHLRWISLDLSCNHLGNACCEILSKLFQFTPLLNKLNLSFTGIVGSRCENSPSQCLLQLKGLKRLSHFDCSGNSLNRNDLSLLFSSLAFSDTCLRHLNLSACWQTPVGVLNSIVDEFTTMDLSKLQSLNLGSCDLSPRDISAFASRVLPTMLGLEVLTLSENARLDTASFGVVLEASVTHSLHSLVFCNCALTVPFGDRVLNALQSKLLLVDAKLQYLKFTLSHAQNYANDADIRRLEELWSSAWPFCASPHPYRSRFGFDFEFSCN